MEIVQPRSLTRRLLRIIEKCGGVIDGFFAAVDHDPGSMDELHRNAATLVLRALKEQTDVWSEQSAEKKVREFGGRREDVFWMTLDPGHVPAGKQISVDEFLYGSAAFDQDFVTHGFVQAFCDPPYSFRGDADRLLQDFKHLVLHDLPPTAGIWQWKPEGSNYFDAGKEWWGSFFWTVRPTPGRIIVALLASTTD